MHAIRCIDPHTAAVSRAGMALFWKVRSAGDVTAAYYGYENGLWWVRMYIGRRRLTFWYRDGDYAAKVFYTAVGLTKGS